MHPDPRSQKLAGASLLILANKQDLAGSLTVHEIAQELGLSTASSGSSTTASTRGDGSAGAGGDEAGALHGTTDGQIFMDDGEEAGLGDGRHWTIMGCSAMTGEGLVSGVDWVVKDISSRIFMLS